MRPEKIIEVFVVDRLYQRTRISCPQLLHDDSDPRHLLNIHEKTHWSSHTAVYNSIQASVYDLKAQL